MPVPMPIMATKLEHWRCLPGLQDIMSEEPMLTHCEPEAQIAF